MIYPRELINGIKPFLRRKEFIAIVGPRQSGKTTFLELLTSFLHKEMKIEKDSIKSITFEDRRLLAQFEADPVPFIHSYIPVDHSQTFYLMIDEFQYADDGGQKLKLIFDTIKNVKVIITGSSSLDIKAHVGKFMVGRILNFYLHPFNFGEFLKTRDQRLERSYRQHSQQLIPWLLEGKSFRTKSGEDLFYEELVKHYEEFYIWGGYPAVVLSKDLNERKKVLGDIYNNYILKDIKALLELATENNLYHLSQYLAAQVGNITVYQNLGQASGLDYRKLKKHLNILKETFICQEVKPFFRNRQKELSKNPKIYFIDMGFRNNLIENMNSLEKRTDAGAIIENSVFIRLYALCQHVGKIHFWRTKAGAEVDFVLRTGDDLLPIEVKYSKFETEKISRSLASFIDFFQPVKALILTKNYWGSMKRNKTEVLFAPAYYL